MCRGVGRADDLGFGEWATIVDDHDRDIKRGHLCQRRLHRFGHQDRMLVDGYHDGKDGCEAPRLGRRRQFLAVAELGFVGRLAELAGAHRG